MTYPGLNLTKGSLRAILKYPWIYSNRPDDPSDKTGKKPKWGAYDCDRDAFSKAWGRTDGGQVLPKAAEAELMDWADDVTYSVHDVEDFFRAGLIPLHLLKSYGATQAYEPKLSLRRERRERERFFEYVVQSKHKDSVLDSLSQSDIAEIFDNLLIYANFAFEQTYEGTGEDHARLRTFTSRLINRFINSLKLCEPSKTNESNVSKDLLARQEIAILKQLTWFYVIDAPSLAMQHEAQKKIVDRLCCVFLSAALEKKPTGILPIHYRELLSRSGMSDDEKSRTAIDLIASLTENQAIAVYQRIEGIATNVGLDKVLV